MDAYTGEIRVFTGNFAPRGWALCNGQLLSIAQNTALYAILGTKYGGDGKTTFALPNLQGKTAMHQGAGGGLTPRVIGESGGTSSVTLTVSELPSHRHIPNCNNTPDTIEPQNSIWSGKSGRGSTNLYSTEINSPMSPLALGSTGGNQSHNNMQPYLGVNFIIYLNGEFPPRS
ncbi:tail fiber protein [Lysinibacillus sp. KU-BSD001]|uniref:phage tail protein n=1 Tax=Lysinibacillus sp. KU-BSD001 TaxID=3141328 RepID=UPI0036DFD367